MTESLSKRKAILSWSGGKDCALALERLQAQRATQIVGLLTTIARDESGIYRVPIHGVRRELIERQAEALALPVHFVEIPMNASNAAYESALANELAKHQSDELNAIVFGDLFLEDIRAYREAFFARAGWQPLFPLWREETRALCFEFIREGFKSIITSVDAAKLDAAFAGRIFDENLLAELSTSSKAIDLCGERGEFHTFVFDAPLFARPIEFSIGAHLRRNGYDICDLIPR